MKKHLIQISIAVMMLLIVNGCGTTCKMNTKKQLSAHAWELNTLRGSVPDMNEFRTGMPFLLFGSKSQLTGSTGCNNIAGSFKVKKACLTLDPGAITRMACQGNGESHFLEALKQVKNMKLEGEKLTLLDGTKEVMTLVSKK
jgi:heat shock protein HslJ